MHFSILLIGVIRTMRFRKIGKKGFYGIMVAFFILYTNCLVGQAGESIPDVGIQLMDKPQISDIDISAKLEIKFNDVNYYNDQIYLSYHIFDDMGDVVKNENERVKIDLDADGRQILEVEIDMIEAKQLAGHDNLYIEFDVIDEKSACWFSTEAMNFGTTSIKFNTTLSEKLYEEVYSDLVIFVLNVTVAILFGFFARVWHKRMSE